MPATLLPLYALIPAPAPFATQVFPRPALDAALAARRAARENAVRQARAAVNNAHRAAAAVDSEEEEEEEEEQEEEEEEAMAGPEGLGPSGGWLGVRRGALQRWPCCGGISIGREVRLEWPSLRAETGSGALPAMYDVCTANVRLHCCYLN